MVLNALPSWSIPLARLNFAAVWRVEWKPKCSRVSSGRSEVPVHVTTAPALHNLPYAVRPHAKFLLLLRLEGDDVAACFVVRRLNDAERVVVGRTAQAPSQHDSSACAQRLRLGRCRALHLSLLLLLHRAQLEPAFSQCKLHKSSEREIAGIHAPRARLRPLRATPTLRGHPRFLIYY